MKKFLKLCFVLVFLVTSGVHVSPQFTEEEIQNMEKWEEYLKTAEITGHEQMRSREAVTSPYVLDLEKDGISRKALWKNPEGRVKGFLEGWQWEIAAYRLNKYLGLNMVPPTVEKRFQGNRGSCQLWINAWMSLKDKYEKDISVPPINVLHWNRCLYLQRAFDNLIANEDRHQNQYLITKDWRMLLIDHSRSFRTSRKFTRKLIYDEKYREGSRLMKQLPREFVEKLKSLNQDVIKEVVGEYLTDKEIEAVLIRRDLIIDWLNKRIEELGEDKVLYQRIPFPSIN
ncbi:MAG: hypothetical protein GF421_10340 [Candidatus Aminicenantes bacterium]|nr:hypothetical protein [Candidatus Aminicenantes bacterium]